MWRPRFSDTFLTANHREKVKINKEGESESMASKNFLNYFSGGGLRFHPEE